MLFLSQFSSVRHLPQLLNLEVAATIRRSLLDGRLDPQVRSGPVQLQPRHGEGVQAWDVELGDASLQYRLHGLYAVQNAFLNLWITFLTF